MSSSWKFQQNSHQVCLNNDTTGAHCQETNEINKTEFTTIQLIHNLNGIVRIFRDKSHLLEAGHGGIGLGLLFVIHGDSGHVVSTVNIDLDTKKIKYMKYCLSPIFAYLIDILLLVRRAALKCLGKDRRSPPPLAAKFR